MPPLHPPRLRTRLRPEPNRPLGRQTKTHQYGRRRQSRPQRAGTGMIKPVLQDDAFLADVKRASVDEFNIHLWGLGQSGFLVKYANRYLLIDPYLSDSLTRKYDNTDKPHVRIKERVIDPARLDFIDVVTS